MVKHETSSFSPEHIAQFHRVQALRQQVLHDMANRLEVWRYCETKACQRAQSCRRGDATCFHIFMRALPDDERRMFGYAIRNGHAGLSPDEAWAQAQARVADEIARYGA